jgi:hypothetical protein
MKIPLNPKRFWQQLRNELTALFKHSLHDAAKYNGLAIEQWEGMPAQYTAHLDTEHDNQEAPSFIAVNASLPSEEKAYQIALTLGGHLRIQRRDSLVIDRPWKQRLFDQAPVEFRDKVLHLDNEVRAFWLMYWHAGKKDFFGFYRSHPEKKRIAYYHTAISDYIFWRLRIQTWVFKFFYPLALYEN